MRIKIALALTSAIFMMIWINSLLNFMFFSLSSTITFPVLIYLLLSIISLFGSVLFLLEARKVLPRWYLAVPLCISLFLLVMLSLWIYFSGKPFIGGPISIAGILSLTLLALLSPFSVLVFLSLHKHPDSMNAYLAVSCVASLLSMFSLFFTLQLLSLSRGGPTFNDADIPVVIYLAYIMPIIGICFLVRAITYRNPG
jgi:hypothetical protein